jgi:hypothetical protein
MKITEVQQLSTRALFENLDQDNDTGLLTEDLVRIVREHQTGTWSQPMTADELLESLSAGQ